MQQCHASSRRASNSRRRSRLRHHSPPLLGVLFDNQSHRSSVCSLHRRPLLLDALAIFQLKTDREFSIAQRLDVIPERFSRRNFSCAEDRARIIHFYVPNWDRGVVLNGYVDPARAAGRKNNTQAAEDQPDKHSCPQIEVPHALVGSGILIGSLRSRIRALSTTPSRLSCSLSEKTRTFHT